MIANPTADRTRYTRLTSFKQRRLFDPTKATDVQELRHFMEKGNWKDGCPFYAEYPWEDIPAMCKDKYVSHVLLTK